MSAHDELRRRLSELAHGEHEAAYDLRADLRDLLADAPLWPASPPEPRKGEPCPICDVCPVCGGDGLITQGHIDGRCAACNGTGLSRPRDPERDAGQERLTVEEFAAELRGWWRFDEAQRPIQSWHTREDFIQKVLPGLLSRLAPAPGGGE